MNFEVEIEETLSKIIRIEAISERAAYEKIKNDYRQCNIVLDSNDYVSTKFIVKPINANESESAS